MAGTRTTLRCFKRPKFILKFCGIACFQFTTADIIHLLTHSLLLLSSFIPPPLGPSTVPFPPPLFFDLTPFIFSPVFSLAYSLNKSFVRSLTKVSLSHSISILNNFIPLRVYLQLTASVLADKWHAEVRLLVAGAFQHLGFVTETMTVGITGTNSRSHVVSLLIQYSAFNRKAIRPFVRFIYS